MTPPRFTVLVVDDAVANLRLLGAALSGEYRVLVATNGPDALRLARAEVPDLILLDIVMPEMDGYSVCSELKADPETRSIPVIFITALSHEEDEARGLDAGAIDYVTKPFRASIVRARVRNHIELKRYRDRLEGFALLDGLTGIGNRRQFDQALVKEWSRAARERQPLSLVMMDLDFFKAFNDGYGHVAGDDCLRSVATALQNVTRRPADLVTRYGGEEFAMILPFTGSDGARQLAEAARRRVEELAIPHAFCKEGHVTLSVGVATVVPLPGRDATQLVLRADAMLYEAKLGGRNRVVAVGH